jgi:hypothetical protein
MDGMDQDISPILIILSILSKIVVSAGGGAT